MCAPELTLELKVASIHAHLSRGLIKNHVSDTNRSSRTASHRGPHSEPTMTPCGSTLPLFASLCKDTFLYALVAGESLLTVARKEERGYRLCQFGLYTGEFRRSLVWIFLQIRYDVGACHSTLAEESIRLPHSFDSFRRQYFVLSKLY